MGSGADGDDRDRADVERYAEELDLGRVLTIRRLSLGRSGSRVLRLATAGSPMIMKITDDPARLARARTELQLVSRSDVPELTAVLPTFVAGVSRPDSVCLVLGEHQPLPPSRRICGSDWIRMASALGALQRVRPPVGWGRQVPAPREDEVAAATGFWTRLGQGEAARRASDLVGISGLVELSTRSLVLEHGDCHTENIVRDAEGAFRWIDWQEARLGDGFADLAFLWQRAEFAGARPPRDAMIVAYGVARRLSSTGDLRSDLALAELRLVFLSWPPFLAYGNPAARRRMIDRLSHLVDSIDPGNL